MCFLPECLKRKLQTDTAWHPFQTAQSSPVLFELASLRNASKRWKWQFGVALVCNGSPPMRRAVFEEPAQAFEKEGDNNAF
jgi:hypothetical protein